MSGFTRPCPSFYRVIACQDMGILWRICIAGNGFSSFLAFALSWDSLFQFNWRWCEFDSYCYIEEKNTFSLLDFLRFLPSQPKMCISNVSSWMRGSTVLGTMHFVVSFFFIPHGYIHLMLRCYDVAHARKNCPCLRSVSLQSGHETVKFGTSSPPWVKGLTKKSDSEY